MYFSISAMYANMATMYEVKKKTTQFSHRHIIFLKLSENYEQCKCNAAHSETSIVFINTQKINLIQVYESLYGHRIIRTNMLLCISACFFKDDCIHSILVYPIYNRAHSTSNWSKTIKNNNHSDCPF